MPNVIQHKRNSTPGTVPGTGSLAQGEIGINISDGKFYTKNNSNNIINLGVSSISGTVITPASGLFSGSVGVGTTTPSEILDISSSVGTAAQVTFTSANGHFYQDEVLCGYTFGYNGTSPKSIIGRMDMVNENGTTNWYAFQNRQYTGLAFSTVSAGVLSEKFRITHDGKVGIGTATPDVKLHVVGDARFDSSTTASVINLKPINRAIEINPSEYNDINLQVNGQNIFRGLDNWTGTWADSVSTTYFQVGRAAGNTIFTSAGGNSFNRLAYSADKYLFTNQTGNISVPANYFNVEYNGTSIISAKTDGKVGIGTTTPEYKLQVNGSFGATTKSFRIDHPSRPNYTLEYGSLESPYHGVRLTGRGKVVKGSGTVLLPSYLKDLIHDDENINIQITNIKHGKNIYIDNIDLNNDQFTVRVDRAKTLGDLEFFWVFTGVRKDVDNLVVEREK